MTSNSRLDAIHPHTYGLKAASACDPLIAQLIAASIPEAIKIIEQIESDEKQQRIMCAFINYSATGDRDTLAETIKGYEYLQANLYLGKHMHALRIIDELPEIEIPSVPLDQMPVYPQDADEYEPSFPSMVKVLRDTSMPSHAPTAAIPAATCLI